MVLRGLALSLFAVLALLIGCDEVPVRINLGTAGTEAAGPVGSVQSCDADGDCAALEPYCHASLGVCVECRTDPNCGNEFCEVGTGQCVQCRSSGDCKNDKPYCQEQKCVECLDEGNCSEEGTTCDTLQNKCVNECATDADCVEKDRLRCEPSARFCVPCLMNDDCEDPKPLCSDMRCVECASDADCSGPKRVCDVDVGQCVECPMGMQCSPGCDAVNCP